MSERGKRLRAAGHTGDAASNAEAVRRTYASWNQGTADKEEEMDAIVHLQLG